MYQIACPTCETPAIYDAKNSMHMCQFCSASFTVDAETGRKETFSSHYIVPNVLEVTAVKETVHEWIRRIHHQPGAADKEFTVSDIVGTSLPFWVVSLEVRSVWKGLIRRQRKNTLKVGTGSDYLQEKGEFRRSYRWAINARHNICETWGIARLHEPSESVYVEWDGFPLDSTMSRGRLDSLEEGNEKHKSKNIFDRREYFEFRYANGLPVMGIEVKEEEAVRRSLHHTQQYHYALAKQNLDYLLDIRTDCEIAGVQLLHLPFWHATYQYRPQSLLRHFYRPTNKNILIEGSSRSIIKGELAMVYDEKVWINALICFGASSLCVVAGFLLHPSLYLVALFGFIVAGVSATTAIVRKNQKASAAAKIASSLSGS